MPKFIVVAHLPLDPDSAAFTGDMAYHPTEWTIYEGTTALQQATGRANIWRQHFRHVAIHTLGKEVRA